VRKFYALVDDFHRMWDVVTEFDSLNHLATQMVPVRSYSRQAWAVHGPAPVEVVGADEQPGISAFMWHCDGLRNGLAMHHSFVLVGKPANVRHAEM
jgi:hypothetical protein